MASLFNLSIPQLAEWSRHQLPDHRQMNEPVQRLNQMATGIASPRAIYKVGAPPWRTVVLIKEPNLAEDTWLDVRAVHYLDAPPIALSPIQTEPRVSYATDVFRAYPKIGYRLADFVGFAFDDIDDEGDPRFPDLTAVFMEAHRSNAFWLMAPPVTQERYVICRDYLPTDTERLGLDRMVIVQEVMPELDAEGAWTGNMQISGEPTEMNVWPFMKAADFEPFFWLSADLNDSATILPVTFWHGTWWLKQRPKRAVSLRRGPLQLVDCQPMEGQP